MTVGFFTYALLRYFSRPGQSDTNLAEGDFNIGVARYNSYVSWLTCEL